MIGFVDLDQWIINCSENPRTVPKFIKLYENLILLEVRIEEPIQQ
jgi:hypothetical protein